MRASAQPLAQLIPQPNLSQRHTRFRFGAQKLYSVAKVGCQRVGDECAMDRGANASHFGVGLRVVGLAGGHGGSAECNLRMEFGKGGER